MVKFLGDNPATTNIRDKNLLVVEEGGKDYIGSWAVLLDNLKTDLIRPILKVQIGKIVMNMDNSKRDVEVWNDGVFEYQLCNGRNINAESCPDLAAIYGATTPNFKNATARHIPTGDSRTLGSYQEDALQNITGTFAGAGENAGFEIESSGAFFFGTDYQYGGSATYNRNNSLAYFDASRVARTASETRMQNVAVQFYVISKVII